MVPHASNIIAIAESHIGLSEDPRGSNDGQALRLVLAKTQFQPGEPWCMYFAITCVIVGSGGIKNLPPCLLNSGSCEAVAEHARKSGRVGPDPATGCIFVLPRNGSWYHHAGIVVGVNQALNLVETIEGNSNDSGSREGFEVVRHHRPISSVDYITWE